jgi:hypothetical protein
LRTPENSLKDSVNRKLNYRSIFILFLAIWFLVNLLQAVFMEILSDEAYYGLFGRYLDWGYYDHPPMVALMTRISSVLFSGNLGIRFMSVLLQTGTIILIWLTADFRTDDRRTVVIFFLVAASISMFSAYGVLAAPDSPLLFFTALAFFAYRKFLAGAGWKEVLLLAISMAGLVYSKYQAVLVIGFLVLSNLKLLKNYRFLAAGVIALLILSPHIYWQLSNDFPSFRYHLVTRSAGFRWNYFLEYLPNQMAVFNPFTLGAVVYVMFRYRPDSLMKRNYYLQIAGFLVFFWMMSFRGHVEPHWTIACSIPMILILTEKCSSDPSLLRYAGRFILPSILLLVAIRLILMTDIRFVRDIAFGGKEIKYRELADEAEGLPLVFTGAFQRPSLYNFFTGGEAVAVSSVYSRQTQFDLWQFEKKYHNRPAFICLNQHTNSEIYVSDTMRFGGFRTDSLQTVNRMKIEFDSGEGIRHSGDTLQLSFSLHNPCEFDIDFNHRHFPVSFSMVFIRGKILYIYDVFPCEPVNIVGPGETVHGMIPAHIPDLPAGKYSFGLSLNTLFGPSLNSSFKKLKIEKDD